MTKEELKKEAEEKGYKYLDKVEKIYGDGDVSDTGYTGYQIIKAYEQGALDFAEPREKRIAELEAQIEKMKCCQNCKYYSWCPKDCSKNEPCEGYNKWELKEIKEK